MKFRENTSCGSGSATGKSRERPVIGDRRNSDLGKIQPDHWLAEYTTELLNLLHVLGRLVALHPAQADLLARICEAETIPAAELNAGDADAVAESGAKYGPAKLVLNQLSFFLKRSSGSLPSPPPTPSPAIPPAANSTGCTSRRGAGRKSPPGASAP